MPFPSNAIVKRKQLSGAAKLKAYGKRAIMLAATRHEYAWLKNAANHERRPLSQFILFYAMQAANKAISKSQAGPRDSSRKGARHGKR